MMSHDRGQLSDFYYYYYYCYVTASTTHLSNMGGYIAVEALVYHVQHTHKHGTLYIAPSLSLFKLFNQTQISSDRRCNKLATLYWPQGTRFGAGKGRGTDVEETRPWCVPLRTIPVYLYIYIYTYGVKTTCIYICIIVYIYVRFSFSLFMSKAPCKTFSRNYHISRHKHCTATTAGGGGGVGSCVSYRRRCAVAVDIITIYNTRIKEKTRYRPNGKKNKLILRYTYIMMLRNRQRHVGRQTLRRPVVGWIVC